MPQPTSPPTILDTATDPLNHHHSPPHIAQRPPKNWLRKLRPAHADGNASPTKRWRQPIDSAGNTGSKLDSDQRAQRPTREHHHGPPAHNQTPRPRQIRRQTSRSERRQLHRRHPLLRGRGPLRTERRGSNPHRPNRAELRSSHPVAGRASGHVHPTPPHPTPPHPSSTSRKPFRTAHVLRQ